MELFDKIKEEIRESVTGSNPANDLRARLHADHEVLSRILDELKATESHEMTRREDLRRRLVVELTAHTRAEEEVVYVELTGNDATRELGERALLEHGRLDRALDDLRAVRCVDPTFLARVDVLDDLLREHIHDEESHILPHAESVLGQPELARLIPRFEERKTDWRARLGEERRRRGRERAAGVH